MKIKRDNTEHLASTPLGDNDIEALMKHTLLRNRLRLGLTYSVIICFITSITAVITNYVANREVFPETWINWNFTAAVMLVLASLSDWAIINTFLPCKIYAGNDLVLSKISPSAFDEHYLQQRDYGTSLLAEEYMDKIIGQERKIYSIDHKIMIYLALKERGCTAEF
ncbi:hypothetical protein [Neptuniibacter sp. QD37_11]|uniref:hypothetical protein n=1 Tax=Neptuniibacter sp. QD37_11 TaxID=3398209 RepID=UPI0039F57F9A